MNHFDTEKPIRIATLSDIHLGNSRTPTRFILDNLERELLDSSLLLDLDILVFAGDVYDRLLNHNSFETIEIDLFMVRMLKKAKKHDVTVYVLEGTRSHDRNQPKRLLYLNEGIGGVGADLMYFDQLTIHHDIKRDLQLLFVPDELHHDPDVTFNEVLELMESKGLRKLDFAFMHGSFHHQLPEVVKAPNHNKAAYESIIEHAIFIGHIHRMTILDKIYAQGSFDRISHNEEDPKGFFKAALVNRKHLDVTFIENKGAKIYKTIDCVGLDLNESLTKVRQAVDDFPEGSYVRLLIPKTNPLFNQMELLITQFPTLVWEKKEFVIKDSSGPKLADTVLDYTPVYITPENIVSLMTERLRPLSIDHSAEVINTALNYLTQITEAKS